MATIHDVAKAAGVSSATISRYLNKSLQLPQATKDKIDTAIAQLEYRPNLLAKRLSKGKTEAIGLVIPEISNPFFAQLAEAVEIEADVQGYAVFITSTHGERRKELAAIDELRDQHVDGLILMIENPDDGTLAAQLSQQMHVVLLDEDIPGPDLPRIFVNNEHGAYLATSYLIQQGHRDIAIVGGPKGISSMQERLAGFERAMAEHQLIIHPEYQLFGEYCRFFGRKAAQKILDLDHRPTAIFSASDYLAIGMIELFRSENINVPDDISLVGFDDMPFVDLIQPSLSTVQQPVTDMGRVAVKTLINLIDGQAASPLTRMDVALVERNSVKNMKDNKNG